jgi:hypothetical protein
MREAERGEPPQLQMCRRDGPDPSDAQRDLLVGGARACSQQQQQPKTILLRVACRVHQCPIKVQLVDQTSTNKTTNLLAPPRLAWGPRLLVISHRPVAFFSLVRFAHHRGAPKASLPPTPASVCDFLAMLRFCLRFLRFSALPVPLFMV